MAGGPGRNYYYDRGDEFECVRGLVTDWKGPVAMVRAGSGSSGGGMTR